MAALTTCGLVADGLDVAAVERLRGVRNTGVAHLDRDVQLAGLVAAVDSVSGADVNSVYHASRSGFFAACAQDLYTKMFLIHGSKLEGLTVVPQPDVQKPYDN